MIDPHVLEMMQRHAIPLTLIMTTAGDASVESALANYLLGIPEIEMEACCEFLEILADRSMIEIQAQREEIQREAKRNQLRLNL